MKKRILLVEDNPKDEALTIRALNQANVANGVDVARDGAEALDYLFAEGDYADRDPEELPVVVLLDLKLPKLDGIEVLQRIRSNETTALVPVVILTSSDEERDRLDSYVEGANGYVRKPVEFTAFAEAVRQLGIYWAMINDPV